MVAHSMKKKRQQKLRESHFVAPPSAVIVFESVSPAAGVGRTERSRKKPIRLVVKRSIAIEPELEKEIVNK